MQSKKDPCKLAANDEELLKKRGFKIGDPINSGSFACVYRATYNDDPCAVKVIDLEKTSEDYRLKFLPREIYTMKKLKHKHLIEILEIFVAGNKVMVFMELCEGGDFLDYLHETRKPFTEERAKYFYLQYGDALLYMHKIGFAHRDIKCENILLNKPRTISKLTDYGFTRTCLERNTSNKIMLSDTYCGSAAYVAPEVLRSTPYNPMISDVWSMGVVLFVLLNNRLPFGDRDPKKLLKAQVEGRYRFIKPVSKDCQDLVALHLNPDPATRVTMRDIFKHCWFGIEAKSSDEFKEVASKKESSKSSRSSKSSKTSKSLKSSKSSKSSKTPKSSKSSRSSKSAKSSKKSKKSKRRSSS